VTNFQLLQHDDLQTPPAFPRPACLEEASDPVANFQLLQHDDLQTPVASSALTTPRPACLEEAGYEPDCIDIPDGGPLLGYMESDLDSCEVPVIEIPYWKVSKDHGRITLYNWEFGVGDIEKWPFDETHYNSWMKCWPQGISKSCKCK